MALRDRLRHVDRIDDRQGTQALGHYRTLLREAIDAAELAALGPAQRRARLERTLLDVLRRDGPLLTPGERRSIVRRIVDEALGYGVLEPLLADPSVTEVMVNGHDDIHVERHGRIERVPTGFTGEDQLRQTIDRIVSGVNRRVDESSPMVDARLPSGERVHVVIPPLAIDGPVLTIRRFPRAFRLHELVGAGALDQPTADLLAVAVRARCNVVVSGGTGSGKTTVLNALSGLIPAHERIITVEDAAELQLQQDHVIRLEARPPNVEGAGQVTIRDLVRGALRMRPDRIVVGEVRGGEALDMLQAMNTGHEGSLCTVHANSAPDAVRRLEVLASMSELPVPFAALHDQVSTAVDLVVHLGRAADGTRRAGEVAFLTSTGQEPFALAPACRWLPDGRGGGAFVHHRLPPHVLRRLARADRPVPGPFTQDLLADDPDGEDR